MRYHPSTSTMPAYGKFDSILLRHPLANKTVQAHLIENRTQLRLDFNHRTPGRSFIFNEEGIVIDKARRKNWLSSKLVLTITFHLLLDENI